MRIHSDIITASDIRDAVGAAGAWVLKLETRGSRKRAHAFELALGGDSPYRSQADREEHAATWDQWGIAIARLYAIDRAAIIGRYPSADAFDAYTRFRFDDLSPADMHRVHRWQYSGGLLACRCGAETDNSALTGGRY